MTWTWQEIMQPVHERQPLDVVVIWWADAWEWRTQELAEGRGNPYDWDLYSRVPRSMTQTKFPWLRLDDHIALASLVRKEAKRRAKTNLAWKEYVKGMRRYMSDVDAARRAEGL